jgi:hypothetical protein
MPTVEGVDSTQGATDCQPVTELFVYMNQEWTKYEPSTTGGSNMPFVMATSGLKAEQAGQTVYAEMNFSEGMESQYGWDYMLDENNPEYV